MKKSLFVLLIASVLSLASCDKNPQRQKNKDSLGGSINAVSLSQESIDVNIGKRSSDVTVTIDGEGNFNKGVKLTSDNEAVATTSFTEVETGQTFKVYGLTAGTAKINVVSIQDESKAASLSVTVKAKETPLVEPEIMSFYLDKDTKGFELGGSAVEFTLTVTGKGEYDNTASVAVKYMDLNGKEDAEHPCVTVPQTSVTSGVKFEVTPSATNTGTAEIVFTSNQDIKKTATLRVRVEDPTPAVDPEKKDVKLDYLAKTLTEGEEFNITAQAFGGDIVWTLKETNAGDYLEILSSSNEGASVRAKAPTNGVTLVATVGEAVAECVFVVEEQPKDIRDLYVSNNGSLNYSEIYFYAWNDFDGKNAEWPGEKLTEYEENTNNEHCYKFSVDILKYPYFKFSDGTGNETPEGNFNGLGENNNIWYESTEAGLVSHFAKFTPNEPTIRFNQEKAVIYSDEIPEKVYFTCIKGVPQFEIKEGNDVVTVSSIVPGSIEIKGLKVGTAKIRVYIPETEAEDTLTVHVLDASEVKAVYFTNNRAWENVYFYAWGGSKSYDWPGQKLSSDIMNNLGQEAFLMHLNIAETPNFMFNAGEEGEKTEDIALSNEAFEDNNNIWVTEEYNEEGGLKVGYATFTPYEYSISFGEPAVGNEVQLDKNGTVNVKVSAVGGENVNYAIAEGADCIELVQYDHTHVKMKWLKEGTAKLVASIGTASETLTITCTETEAIKIIKTFVFSKPNSWADAYFYAWDDAYSVNQGWPGVKLGEGEKIGKNSLGEDLYQIDIDALEFTSFIINAGADGAKTSNINLFDITDYSLNNIYIGAQVGDTNEYTPMFTYFHAIELSKHEVSVEIGDSVEVSAYHIANGTMAVVSASEAVATTTQVVDGKITISGVSEGTTTVTVSVGEGSEKVEEVIFVNVIPLRNHIIYFYNSYTTWTDFHVYLFNSETKAEQAAWPGIALNGDYEYNEDLKKCYPVEVNLNKYDSFIISGLEDKGGEEKVRMQSIDIMFSWYLYDDLFTFDTEGDHYIDGKANVIADTFVAHTHDYSTGEEPHMCACGAMDPDFSGINVEKTSVILEVGENIQLKVSDSKEEAMSVVSASEAVATTTQVVDGKITITGASIGSTTVTVSAGAAPNVRQETINVEVKATNNKTFYFYNSYSTWTDFRLYVFNSVTHEQQYGGFPGLSLSSDAILNSDLKECYAVEVNMNKYDSFIISGLEDKGGEEKVRMQSIDVAFNDHASSNMFTFDTEGSHYVGGKASVIDGNFVEHVHDYTTGAIPHTCICNAYDPDATDPVTIRFSNSINATSIKVKQWKNGSTPDYSEGLISPSSHYINEMGQTVYSYVIDKLNNDKISFVIDVDNQTKRTVDIDLREESPSWEVSDTSCWYPDDVVNGSGQYEVHKWTYSATRDVYLDIGTWSESSDGTFFAYYWDDTNGIAAVGVKMTHVSGNIYTASIPTQAHKVIFVRCQNGTETFGWDKKWNQTGNLDFGSKNKFTVTGWGDEEHGTHSPGSWSTYA